MIEFVFLDLDDTILDFGWAERRALTAELRSHGFEPDDAMLRRYSEINVQHWQMLERGELTREQTLVRRFAVWLEELGLPFDPEVIQVGYESRLGSGHCFIDGAPELLDALVGRYRLFIASNGCASVQAGRIESAGIARYFERMFVSELMGADKPSREYFELCFSQIEGFDPSKAVIIGDSLTSDILGGLNTGMHTVWFDPNGRPSTDIVPEYTVRSLSEIPPLLEKM